MTPAAARPRRSWRSGRSGVAIAVIATAAAIGFATVAPGAPAFAHDYLISTTPEPGAVQTKPLDAVSLTFDDIVLDLGDGGATSIVQVTGPDGANTHFETGCPVVKDRTVTTPVDLGPSGDYEIRWQIVSADGHVVSETTPFSYRLPEGTSAAAGSKTAPCEVAGSAPVQSGQAAVPAPEKADHSTDAGIIIGIAVGIVVLAVLGVGIVLFTSRKRGE